MPSKVAFGSLAILVLALAACGKQDVATTAPAPTTAPATTTALATSTPPPSQRPVQAATYTIRLAGIDGERQTDPASRSSPSIPPRMNSAGRSRS